MSLIGNSRLPVLSSAVSPSSANRASLNPLKARPAPTVHILMLHILEVGGLAAKTTGCFKTASLLTDTLPAEEAAAGWLRLEAQAPAEQVTFLAMDVEMVERRSDKLRLPIRVALVQCELAPGEEPSTSIVFDGFVDPSVVDASWASGDAEAWDYKEAITGYSHADLVEAHTSGRMTPLRDVQRLIARALHGAAFAVGHNLQSDLRCLRVHGACLGRRMIDTQFVYRKADGASPSLKALVAAMLADGGAPEAWASFQAVTLCDRGGNPVRWRL